MAGRSQAGRAHGLLAIWRLWERFASWWWRAPPIPGAPHGILRLRLTTYSGSTVELPDGTTVRRGDPVGEFHIQSSALVESSRHSRWDVLVDCRDDLRALARWTESPECPAGIEAFYGVTLLGRGAARLGFVSHPLPLTLYRRFERLYLSGLLLLYSYEGQRRYNRGETRTIYPEEVWLTRKELMRRYGVETGSRS